ncbi:PREDICTED: sugar transporter ERD6-like 15 isoform X1 [Brassica oleracea var. oleracea]|uniref:sugar transporter ERD6-like 15 isoform X1 n=1 Tax=Brassica oleracea var. oleracea TaxID=109376 RepID=UPI0006A70612|nr:PREDICTED: sugar transporter ERD6-like 15 isoform X1 [Brassica oleracea var. oleracea]
MAEEVSLLSSPSESSTSLLSEISNASTRAFVLAFTVGSCGAFAFGCIIGYSAPTQSSIMKDLNLSIADYSLFGSILTVGLILGALICGKLTDLVGRVYTIWITNILFVIGWFAIAFAKAVWLLDLGRLLQGISIGISAYLGPVYITEIAPRKLRGAACSMSQLFTGVGISVVYALGTVVAWRNLAILGSIPSLMILPLLFFIPESPRWLAKVGREKEVEEILSRLRGENSDVSDEAGEILAYTEHVKQQGDDRGFLKLFQRKYAFSLTIGVVLIALPQLGGLSGYSFYTESIFISTGVSSDVGFISTSIVQMLAGVLGTVLVDVSGRRSLLLVSQAGMFLGCLATAISFFLKENHCWETGTPILALISVTLYFGSYGLGMGSIPSIIASEIYPVDVKGAAGTMCGLASSISSWLIAYSFSFLFQWSTTGTFLMFTTVTGIGFVFIAKLVPETRGKSLEEIQSLFSF